MKKVLLPFFAILLATALTAQTTDSLSKAAEFQQFLFKNKETVKDMVEAYKKVFDWKQLVADLVGFCLVFGIAWKFFLKNWITEFFQKKAIAAVESMSDLKQQQILVVSSPTASTEFLEDFFEIKKFEKVEFLAVEKGKTPPPKTARYSLIFANNDDGQLDIESVSSYVKDRNVLFYFGKSGSWPFGKSPEIDRKLNLANSRAQIYGNLMSSLEFLELVKPKIKNV